MTLEKIEYASRLYHLIQRLEPQLWEVQGKRTLKDLTIALNGCTLDLSEERMNEFLNGYEEDLKKKIEELKNEFEAL
jgi:hypothetical protein